MAYEVSESTMELLRGARAIYIHATRTDAKPGDLMDVTCDGAAVTVEVVGVNGVDMTMRRLVMVRMVREE